MKFDYAPRGVCSYRIHLDLNETANTINSVRFEGGCSGNTQGVAALVQGMDIDEAIAKLSGIHCGPRPTSCPDQLSLALQKAKERF